MKRMSIIAAIAHFSQLATDANNQKALEEAAKLIQQEAKDSLGTYQSRSGPVPAWKPLAESTKEERVRKGFTPDDPLLRDGGLRDSIEYVVTDNAAYVGSDDPAAAPMELGTGTVPARSFLSGAAYRKQAEVAEIIGQSIVHKIVR